MHEWALAEGVISTSEKVANEQGLKEITEVVVGIGELQQIDNEIFRYALEQLRTPIMKNAKFILQDIEGKLACRICGEEWVFSNEGMEEDVSEAIHFVPEVAHVYIKCPNCNSTDFEVKEGRGVFLSSIRGLKP
jgi:hydrogenase nickel incorporation protein HypA/HybF